MEMTVFYFPFSNVTLSVDNNVNIDGKNTEMSKRKAISRKKKCVCLPENSKVVSFASEINQFRKFGYVCDGLVQCSDQKSVKIHRLILSSVSPYFKAVFTNSLNPNESERTETVVEINSCFFNLLLDFAYTGNCQISNENVHDLLICADRYQVVGLVELCCQYLIANLNYANCLNTLGFAKQYFCKRLEISTKSFVKQNFIKIFEQCPGEFLKLNVEEVIEILSDDELNIKNENIVLKAIQSWIRHDQDERKKFVSQLIKCVRFYQKNQNYNIMKRLRKWRLLLDECQDYEYMLLGECTVLKYNVDGVQQRPRIPYDILFAIGGWDSGSPTNLIETYDIRADKWFVMGHIDNYSPRSYHGVCCLDKKIYVIGGFDGNRHFNTVQCYNPVTKNWGYKACMYQVRCFVSVTVLDSKIYALGGFNGMSRLSSAERYCPIQNQWELIASMNKQRSDAGATSIDGKIYIIGGIDGRQILSSAEVYDPETNQWTYIRSMPGPRSGVSLVAHEGILYCLGGFNGQRRLSSCEKLDPDNGEDWRMIPSMIIGRSNFVAVVMENNIFAIGGYDGTGTIATVEAFNIFKEEWISVHSMNISRSALSACVLSGLPNAREYSYACNSVVESVPHTSGVVSV